jgi:hypothetical protein
VNYPASLVPLQSVVEVELVIEDPFVSDDIRANGTRDKILDVFLIKTVISFFMTRYFGYARTAEMQVVTDDKADVEVTKE